MIEAREAIRAARALIGTPYSELDCINLIKRVIRTAQGGVPGYKTAGTNTLWRSAESAAKYRDLTWRQEGIEGAKAGMLAFKRAGDNIHHVGLVTGEGTVIHSSSAKGCVVETELGGTWQLLAVHRYIAIGECREEKVNPDNMNEVSEKQVKLNSGHLNLRDGPSSSDRDIGDIPNGAVVEVLIDGDWPFVRYGGKTGYVCGEYLANADESVNDSVVDADVSMDCTKWGVFVPCSDKEQAELLASFFNYRVVCQKEVVD